MVSDVRERVEAARQALDRIEEVLASPKAAQLGDLPVVRLAVGVDATAAKLAKLADQLAAAASAVPPTPQTPKIRRPATEA